MKSVTNTSGSSSARLIGQSARILTCPLFLAFVGALTVLVLFSPFSAATTTDTTLPPQKLETNLLTVGNIFPLPLRTLPVHNVFENTWDDSGIVIHHSVANIPANWSGGQYLDPKYVMTYTPFRTLFDENPHIAFSNDGVNWFETLIPTDGSDPDTVPNPIWSPSLLGGLPAWQGVPIAHLSDPDIILDSAGTIWLFFRIKIADTTVTAKYQIVVTKSENFGVNWSVPTIIIDTDRGDPVKGGLWSPAVWYDTSNTYRMMGVYTNAWGSASLDTVNRVALWKCLGSQPDGPWVEDTVLYDFLPADTASRDWWHPEIINRGGDELVLLMTTTGVRQNGSEAHLFLATSCDNGYTWDSLGEIFSGSEFDWTDIPFAYRAGGVHRYTARGEAIDVWLSGKDTSILNGENVRTGTMTLFFEPPCDPPASCVPCCFNAGNADGSVPDDQISSAVNVGDITYLIRHIFLNGPPAACEGEADSDGSGTVNIGDVTYLIAFIFSGGPAPVCASQ